MTQPAGATGIAPVHAPTFTKCMEQLQAAYVASVAATAGVTVETQARDVVGFDLLLIQPTEPGVQENSLYVQLKATSQVAVDPAAEHFSHALQRDHFLHLAAERTSPRALLLVMATAPEQAAWTHAEHEALTLRHCCYWVSLEGQLGTVTEDQQSKTVHVPTGQIFDATALRTLLGQAERGEPFGA